MEEKVLEEFKNNAKNVLQALQRDFQGIRTNRPNPALLEGLKISYYDQLVPLKQVGTTSIELPRNILIQVWDKEAVSGVLKAIEASDLGVSVSAEGMIVRVSLPELSQERRGEIIKHVKKVTESYRIQIRNFRDEANKAIQNKEAEGDLAEDEKFKLKDMIQEETDRTNKEIEKLLEAKLSEVKS